MRTVVLFPALLLACSSEFEDDDDEGAGTGFQGEGDTDVDWSGTYDGSWEVTATLTLINYTDTCSGSFTMDVSPADSPNTAGWGDCAWSSVFGSLSNPELAFAGEIDENNGTFSGEAAVFSALDTDFDANVNAWADGGSPELWGTFDGEGVVLYDGYEFDATFSGTFDAVK